MTKTIKLLLILACCLWGAPLNAAEIQTEGACVQHSLKEVKTVTHFAITHRPKSKRILYDDIGCGLKWRKKQCSSIQMSFDTSAVVYDYNTLEEIVVSEATFVQSSEIKSPLGSGLVAFGNPADADAFLNAHAGAGKKLRYQDVVLLDLP